MQHNHIQLLIHAAPGQLFTGQVQTESSFNPSATAATIPELIDQIKSNIERYLDTAETPDPFWSNMPLESLRFDIVKKAPESALDH
jgi:hypothetical protein